MKRRVDRLRRLLFLCSVVSLGWTGLLLSQEPEVTLRVDVVDGIPGETQDGVTAWAIELPSPIPEFVDVEAEIVLASRLEPCASDPQACDGTEGIREDLHSRVGCNDGVDNDGDDLIDADDPECWGVRGWNLAVVFDGCFELTEATHDGTIVGSRTRPPGQQSVECGSVTFDPEVVDAEDNEGRLGVTTRAQIATVCNDWLDPIGDFVILKLRGRISTVELLDGAQQTAPCAILILDPSEGPLIEPDGGETGTILDVRRRLTDSSVVSPDVQGASIVLRSSRTPFLRGDTDANQEAALTDGVFLLNFLFLGGPAPSCEDAADVDDSGALEVTDAVRLFNFLFLGASPPPAPGPAACGTDPSEDELDCAAFDACP